MKNDKSESVARMMSLFLGLTLLLRLVTDVLSDPYLKELVIVNAETAARWSEALIVLSVVRKVSGCERSLCTGCPEVRDPTLF